MRCVNTRLQLVVTNEWEVHLRIIRSTRTGVLLKIARAQNCSIEFLTKALNCLNLFQLESDKTERKTKTHRRLSRSLNFRNSCDFWNIWTKIDRCLEIQMLSFSPPTHISQKNIQINEFLWPLGIATVVHRSWYKFLHGSKQQSLPGLSGHGSDVL